jgi:hypothetical protein
MENPERRKIIGALAGAAFFLLCIHAALSYSFSGQSPAENSVFISLNASKSTGDVIALDIVASNVSGVSYAEFDLDLNKSVLEWAGQFAQDPRGYDRGPFLGQSAIFLIGNEIDSNGTKNRGKLVCGVIGTDGIAKNGSGVIMTVKFRAVGNGTANVSFSNSDLLLSDLNTSANATWLNGSLVYGGEPLQPQLQDNPPLVSLDTPARVYRSGNLSLKCTATDDFGLTNLTLFTNVSGSWAAYASVVPASRTWTQEFSLTDVTDGAYVWNCQANDTAGNTSAAETNGSFAVNASALQDLPERSNGQPSGNLNETNVSISLQTGTNATCRYSFVPGFAYSAMLNTFDETNFTIHSINLTLAENMTYRFFVRCNDTDGNVNSDDFLINFSIGNVSEEIQPPNITSETSENVPYGSPAVIAIRTDKEADCKFSSQSAGAAFNFMNTFSNTHATNHSMTLTGLKEGTGYSYYVKCSDTSGNVNAASTAISFFVCYEVDQDCSRNVSAQELDAYAARWETDPSDVSALTLARALSLWKRGSA